ncbi:MAG: fibronectin type III domain-containing protein [Bacteroidetes bacterium QH_2_63_10]|nr:MAG: fibronectin type III domain-containing protein [Bacteroidetes bacterium QH_2_63_10]
MAFLAGCGGAGANGDEDGNGDRDGDEPTAPAAPSGLEGTSLDGAVELTWEAVEEAEEYDVYRDTESGVDASGEPLVEGRSETGYTDDSAENGTTYYYVVTAVGAEGNESDPSGEVEKTPFDEPPSRPE